MFNVTIKNLPEVSRIEVNGIRCYTDDNNRYYPSITTVLSSVSANKFDDFIEKVGKQEFNKISKRASLRGTAVHDMIEKTLLGVPFEVSPFDIAIYKDINKVLKYVNNIEAIESKLISHQLKTGGTVDCIAEVGNKRCILDWKTTRNKKNKEQIEDYFLQAAFYSFAYEEMTGDMIDNICICIFVDNDKPTIFFENRNSYLDKFKEVRNQYERIQVSTKNQTN